jgi:hypothetical protein
LAQFAADDLAAIHVLGTGDGAIERQVCQFAADGVDLRRLVRSLRFAEDGTAKRLELDPAIRLDVEIIGSQHDAAGPYFQLDRALQLGTFLAKGLPQPLLRYTLRARRQPAVLYVHRTQVLG